MFSSTLSVSMFGVSVLRIRRSSTEQPGLDSESIPVSRSRDSGARLYDVVLVEPIGGFVPADPEADDPDQYRITRRVWRGLTHEDAASLAGDFNDRLIASEGPRPRLWAIVFAPGALTDLLSPAA